MCACQGALSLFRAMPESFHDISLNSSRILYNNNYNEKKRIEEIKKIKEIIKTIKEIKEVIKTIKIKLL